MVASLRHARHQRMVWRAETADVTGFLTRAVMLPIEHPYPDESMGLPSPEALQLATDAIRRRYVLPETMEHPSVRSECMRLAYMIMACGLAPPDRPAYAAGRRAPESS
jgi:hypothetical protein